MTEIPQRVLGIFAHPDDECYCAGGTLAYYASQGAECMVISATRGQAGEIHDAEAATRNTLGKVREQELQASCAALGVQHARCWDYMDGHLSDADQDEVINDVAQAILNFDPDVIITFGGDGAYGHPDHIAIGRATTEALLKTKHPARLYYAYFPQHELLLMEEIANWLTSHKERLSGTSEFAHAVSLFVRESVLLNFSRDFIEIRWYAPDFYILEQGEPGTELFVILSGSVRIQRHHPDGSREDVAILTDGDFFGEIGVASGKLRTADVIAKEATTCLVFSPGERTNYAGRGSDAVILNDDDNKEQHPLTQIDTGDATHMLDVRAFVHNKMRAICAHRTQTPLTPDIFPRETLEQLLGLEFFVLAHPREQLKKTL